MTPGHAHRVRTASATSPATQYRRSKLWSGLPPRWTCRSTGSSTRAKTCPRRTTLRHGVLDELADDAGTARFSLKQTELQKASVQQEALAPDCPARRARIVWVAGAGGPALDAGLEFVQAQPARPGISSLHVHSTPECQI